MATGPTNRRRNRFWLGLLVSLLFLGWAVWTLDWRAVWRALLTVDYGWVLLAVALNGAAFYTRTVRWAALLRPTSVPLRPLFDALLIGQAANYVSPARIGDLLRAYLLGERTGLSKARALGTIALEKLWDILMLFLFTAIVGWFFPLPPWLLEPARGLLLLAVVGGLGLGLLLWRQQQALAWLTRLADRLAPHWREPLRRLSNNLLAGFAAMRDSSASLQTAWWSLLTWLVGGLLNYVVFLAFDLPLSLLPAFLLLVVLQVGVAVPSLPGRIGVFQGICVAVLALFAIPFDLAFGYSLILHLVIFLPPILVAAWLSFRLKLAPGRWLGANDD